MRALASAVAVVLAVILVGCGPKESDQRIDVVVTSGRPQPPPADVAAKVGIPVLVHAEGLGPPRIVVFAPDGSEVATTEVAGDRKFTPSAPGTYRIEQAGAPGLVLVNVVAR